jgi:mRNA-degrading endonuclease YafQ of YafQ-DinJ toxin-antitoxin module
MITFKYFLSLFEAQVSDPKVEFSPLFKESYNKFAHINGVRDNLQEFFRCKKQWPQEKLTSKCKDHALTGGFFQKNKILECHLAGDVLLLYRFSNHIITPLLCCDHDDIKGGKAQALIDKLKPYLK